MRKLKNFIFEGKGHKAISKTELCRKLGMSTSTANLSRITKVKSTTDKSRKRYRYPSTVPSSPYKEIGIKPPTSSFKMEEKKISLPSNKEIERPLNSKLFKKEKFI
jgi:hypothetical protein